MPLFKTKDKGSAVRNSYVELSPPSAIYMRVPIVAVHMSSTSTQHVDRLKHDIIHKASSLKNNRSTNAELDGLVAGLAAVAPKCSDGDTARIKSTLNEYAIFGWAAACIEIDAGIAKPDRSESHINNALAFLDEETCAKAKDLAILASFAIDAGYFFKRTGPDALELIVDIAQHETEYLYPPELSGA